jgi:hypothetical protein
MTGVQFLAVIALGLMASGAAAQDHEPSSEGRTFAFRQELI